MNKKLYLFLSWTWGILHTLPGWIITRFIKQHKNNIYGQAYFFGQGLSGFSLGPYALVHDKASRYLLNHEFGHSIQNCYFGPFMIFITLASIIRYWYYTIFNITKDYDSIWFEGSATKLGNKYFQKFND